MLGDDGRGRAAAVVEELVERGRDDGDVFFGDAEGGGGGADLGDEVADFVGVEGHESGFGVSGEVGGGGEVGDACLWIWYWLAPPMYLGKAASLPAWLQPRRTPKYWYKWVRSMLVSWSVLCLSSRMTIKLVIKGQD